MPGEVLARLAASPVRRLLLLAVLSCLGVLLIYVGVARPPATLGWQLFLLVLGVLALVLASRIWWATAAALELRPAGLFDADGTRICAIGDIASVERGTFAFKPTNGFAIRLKTGQPRAWAPGMWWRLGRRVGVGGVTPAAEGKIMADMLAAYVAEHQDGATAD